MTCGTIKANCVCTIIDVLTAVVSSPAINTDTSMSTNGVEAGTTIVTGIWLHKTLINILSTVLSCPFWCTLAIVGVDAIYTFSTIHTLVAWTVINIILTVVSLKPWQASTLIRVVTGLSTSATIKALRGGTGQD